MFGGAGASVTAQTEMGDVPELDEVGAELGFVEAMGEAGEVECSWFLGLLVIRGFQRFF